MKTLRYLILIAIILAVVFMGMPRSETLNLSPTQATEIHTLNPHTTVEIHTLEPENPHTRVNCSINSGYEDGTVYLREGAGMQYAVLEILHENDELEFLDENLNEWKFVRHGEIKGWINSHYLKGC
jgi:uncharacterized protein YgiM (DUF1202 family)